ncbi:MAG TPA: AMP-binding protein, partial [Acidimicrobiales bacterium]|nr:AMP-binding protein [Acidimicrobiales bacterium]
MSERRTPWTVWEGVEALAYLYGSSTAAEGQFRGESDSFDYEQLRAFALQLSRGLHELGVRRGDVVAVWLPNWIEWILLEFACARLGAAVLGVNTRFRVHEIKHVVVTAKPKVVVHPQSFLGIDFAGILTEASSSAERDGRGTGPAVVLAGSGEPTAGGGAVHFDDLLARGGDGSRGSGSFGEPTDLANIFTTSGSTSSPKLAAHSQGALTKHARESALAFDMRQGDSVLGALPLCGAYGLNSVLAMLSVGGKVILEPTLNESSARDRIARGEVTHLFGGDDVVAKLCAARDGDPSLGRLRRGGVANFTGRSSRVMREVEERSDVRLSGVYGSSELFALAATWPAEMDVAKRSRSGGLPVSCDIRWRVVDVDSEEELAEG